MDLRDYENAKFDLAGMLRALSEAAKDKGDTTGEKIRDLFVRLAEDRFNLAVVGRFGRGKSSLMNALIGDDDDDGQSYWSKVSENDKERSLIVMLPGQKGRMIKLPLGLGLNAFFNMGRVISETMRGVRSPTSAMGEALWGFTDAFNPLGSGGSPLNLIAPTIFDPMVDLFTNRNFAGKPIQPDQSPYDPPATRSRRERVPTQHCRMAPPALPAGGRAGRGPCHSGPSRAEEPSHLRKLCRTGAVVPQRRQRR